jgi:hypothetical protein
MKSHKNRLIIFIVLLVAYLGFGGYYAYMLNVEGHAYKDYMQKSVDEMGGIKRLTDSKEYISMALDGDEMERKKAKSEYYEREATAHEDNTKRWSWFFASISVAVLLIALTLYLSHFFVHGYMAMMLIVVSMVCLWVGISSPMMEIFAYRDGIEFHVYEGTIDLYFWKTDVDLSPELEGKFYFQYQCKSVLDVIHILFEANNYVVGIAILLFSIIFPIIKLIVSFISMAIPSTHRFYFMRIIIHKLGKWSMADVFVVAMFLAYLAFQNMSDQIQTDARVLPGLYYFMSFSILSIVSSFFVDKAARIHDEKTERILMMQMQRDELNPNED